MDIFQSESKQQFNIKVSKRYKTIITLHQLQYYDEIYLYVFVLLPIIHIRKGFSLVKIEREIISSTEVVAAVVLKYLAKHFIRSGSLNCSIK